MNQWERREAGETPPLPIPRGDVRPENPVYSSMAGGSGRPVADRSFERLYQRHVEDVYRYALAVLANRSDAEDVTQTTFLNAYRSYRSGTRPAKPLNWLISIAHNVCRQRFRSAARRPPEVALDGRLAAAAEDNGDRFRAEDIRRALGALTFAQRSALALRELEGRSYREIAEALELSESAVETLIFRARKAFREQLEGTLTCSEAEQAISRQLDGALGRDERGALRSHLRECEECSVLARRFRAQQSALKRFVLVPLPQSLASFSVGGSGVAAGGAAAGAGLGIKALALGSAAIVAVGVTTGEVVTHSGGRPAKAPEPPAHRDASLSVRPTADVSGRLVSAAAAALVAKVRLGPAARGHASFAVRGKRTHHHAWRPRPVHPPHPASGPAHDQEAQVVKHSVSQGNSGHGAVSPAPKQATPTVKPRPAGRHPKRVDPAARRVTHPAPKEHPAARSHGATTSSPKPAPAAVDPGAAGQAKETGKPAHTETGQPDFPGQGREKH
jgi:RNA polymerase sigma factor (sigma-70 family)